MCCSVCECAEELGGDLQWTFLRPKERLLGIDKTLLSGSNAAVTIPLRGGSKATGNSKSFLTAFFLKAQHSAPRSSPLWLGHQEIRFLSHCAIWLPVPGGCGGLGLRTSWCSRGVGEPLSLWPWNWLAAQPRRCPVADPGKPMFWRITGHSCRADTKHQTSGIAFSPWCSERLWERWLSLSVQSKLVCRRVQYLLFGVGEKWKKKLPLVSQ